MGELGASPPRAWHPQGGCRWGLGGIWVLGVLGGAIWRTWMGAISLPCSTLWGWHSGVLGGGMLEASSGPEFCELYPSIGEGCCFTSRL